MNVESFLRGFERALQKRANVAALPGMSSSMTNMPTTTPPTIGAPSLNKKTPMTAPKPPMTTGR